MRSWHFSGVRYRWTWCAGDFCVAFSVMSFIFLLRVIMQIFPCQKSFWRYIHNFESDLSQRNLFHWASLQFQCDQNRSWTWAISCDSWVPSYCRQHCEETWQTCLNHRKSVPPSNMQARFHELEDKKRSMNWHWGSTKFRQGSL